VRLSSRPAYALFGLLGILQFEGSAQQSKSQFFAADAAGLCNAARVAKPQALRALQTFF